MASASAVISMSKNHSMELIELICAETDDPSFVALTGHFLSYYANLHQASFVKVIHIDNWFGRRWLGFAGKFKGIAGIRNRSLDTRLPAPPFRPSRVLSAYDFERNEDGGYSRSSGEFSTIHAEKNGGIIWNLYRSGLYCWYSGNTLGNTTGALMVYDVAGSGNNAWYIMFDQLSDGWNLSQCVNVSPDECSRVIESYREIVGT